MQKMTHVGLTLDKKLASGMGGVKKLGDFYAVPFGMKHKSVDFRMIKLPHDVFWDHLEDA